MTHRGPAPEAVCRSGLMLTRVEEGGSWPIGWDFARFPVHAGTGGGARTSGCHRAPGRRPACPSARAADSQRLFFSYAVPLTPGRFVCLFWPCPHGTAMPVASRNRAEARGRTGGAKLVAAARGRYDQLRDAAPEQFSSLLVHGFHGIAVRVSGHVATHQALPQGAIVLTIISEMDARFRAASDVVSPLAQPAFVFRKTAYGLPAFDDPGFLLGGVWRGLQGVFRVQAGDPSLAVQGIAHAEEIPQLLLGRCVAP